jgi:predicted nucleotide-binding protein
MPSRSKTKTDPPGRAQVGAQQGRRLVDEAVRRGAQLLAQGPIDHNTYASWQLFAQNCLEKAFGANSSSVNSVMGVSRFEGMYDEATQAAVKRTEFLTEQLALMRSLADLLSIGSGASGMAESADTPRGDKVFLVHGHDERVLQECARFLEKLDQQVVILREQANQGRTIIEKFEQQAKDAGFAVVLLTGDDRGGTKVASADQLCSRARQNVIFELGYFTARLGRNRVCALYEPGVELPSDYSGVLYEELDSKGTWKLHLARELREAGMEVDLNKAM